MRGVWRLGRAHAAMTIISAKLKGVRLSNRITRRAFETPHYHSCGAATIISVLLLCAREGS